MHQFTTAIASIVMVIAAAGKNINADKATEEIHTIDILD